MNWQHVDPSPALVVLPAAAASLAEADAAVEQWEFYSGKRLDPSQRLAVQVMLAENVEGRWAARSTGREMPRQNGKGDELECVEFWGLTQRHEAILHTAHEIPTVASAHERMMSLFDHRDLRPKVKKALNGLGQQMLELNKGGIIQYRTRTKGGGRGLDDISRLVIDEAQHAKPEQLASSMPTLLANPNPQMNFVGTGAIAGESGWWWTIRRRAMSDDPGDQFGYVGHTAEFVAELVDVHDRDLWFFANPALSAGRADVEFFAEQLRNLGPELFAREHLGVWDLDVGESSVIPLDRWNELEDKGAELPDGRVVLSLDVSPDRKWTSFAAAGRRSDGVVHVEVVERRPGTGWVVAAAAGLMAAAGADAVRIEKGGPAASLIGQLTEVGVSVDEVSTADHARATGQFIDAALAGRLVHAGQQSLRSAVVGAQLRASGDAELWSRRSSKVDITPLVAATLALGGVPESVGDVKQPLTAVFA